MTSPHIHDQQRRENPEPHEQRNPMPWFVMLLTALLLGFGAIYIARSDLSNEPSFGDGRAVAELTGGDKAKSGSAGTAVDGAAIYASRCAACHQATGAGLPGAFPPLAGSEWVLGRDTALARIVLHGVTGGLTVKGTTYNGVMPAFREQLQDAELAAVLSHIRHQWGNQGAAVNAELVASVRQETANRTESFKGDTELTSLR